MLDLNDANLITEENDDFITLKIDDPEVLVFLSVSENQGVINQDFLEFFTI